VLLHDALARIWAALGDRDVLVRALETGRLPASVQQALEEAREAQVGRGHAAPPPALARVELASLSSALMDWLRLEAQRQAFRVTGLETQHALDLGGVRLNLRIDRIDETPTGERIVIDYRSGAQASPSAWRGARPQSPQLPLYAIALEPPPQALAFALLAPGSQRFVGLADRAGLLPGTEPGDPWADQLATWRQVLGDLAWAHARGEARVDPARGAATCQFCELSALCRVDRADLDGSAAREGEGEAGP
jgi:RecB family exonuclease